LFSKKTKKIVLLAWVSLKKIALLSLGFLEEIAKSPPFALVWPWLSFQQNMAAWSISLVAIFSGKYRKRNTAVGWH
jgi:hypothetical protein